jgi:membrane-associated phospholipid phosphatase
MIAIETTNTLKGLTDRERPDGSDQASFPSGHATIAFSYAAFASRNLDRVDVPEGARLGLRAGFFTLAGAAAWARVEAGKHYPSDVFAGAALGNFIALVIHDAFLARSRVASMNACLGRDELAVEVGFGF